MNKILASLYNNHFIDVAENPFNYSNNKRIKVLRLLKKLRKDYRNKDTSETLRARIKLTNFMYKNQNG